MRFDFITKCTGIYPKHVTFDIIIRVFYSPLDNRVLFEGNVIVNSELIPNSSLHYYDNALSNNERDSLYSKVDEAISQCVNRATWIFSDGKKFEKD